MSAAGLSMLVLSIGIVGTGGDEPTLTLHATRVRPLDDGAKAGLRSLALRFLESSNFNSVQHREILKVTTRQVHAAYRKAVGGRYLLLVFDTPRRVRTIGGEVDVLEVVIGLNRPDYADSLFTIDGEGRVVSHEKYSGTLGIELLQAAEQSLADR